jgi:hypothetical protein
MVTSKTTSGRAQAASNYCKMSLYMVNTPSSRGEGHAMVSPPLLWDLGQVRGGFCLLLLYTVPREVQPLRPMRFPVQ